MYHRLFIGNKFVNLEKIDSTNNYMKELLLIDGNGIEGLVVVAKDQYSGRGQQGKKWESEKGLNLTLSIFLKPNLLVKHQFLISKVISLGIVHFLKNLGLNEVKIKWPNDIYVENRKIAGILIENSIKENKIYQSIIGVGLNVNQIVFNMEKKPTSLITELDNGSLCLDVCLNQLLFFIEKQYLGLNRNEENLINRAYLNYLYGINELRNFKIQQKVVSGIIVGINSFGKLEVNINNEIKTFNLKEIEFINEF